MIGVGGAVAGALLIGIGGATPAFAEVAAHRRARPRRRGGAVHRRAARTARRRGQGLRRRRHRARARSRTRRRRPAAPRRAGSGVGRPRSARTALAVGRRRRVGGRSPLSRSPARVGLRTAALVAAAPACSTSASSICLRATGLLVTDHSITPLHKRQVFGVFAAMFVVVRCSPPSARCSWCRATPTRPRANPSNQGCNGFIELCAQPLNQVVWAGEPQRDVVERVQLPRRRAHHHDPRAAERRRPLPDARRLLRVRRRRPGPHEPRGRRRPEGARRPSAARTRCTSSTALGALTGTADTSGKKQDMYFCHDFCELGAVPAEQIFGDIGDFLDRNLTDVVIIDLEDYVKPKDVKAALIDAGPLRPRVEARSPVRRRCRPSTTWVATNKVEREPSPADRDEREAPGRLPVAPGHLHVSEETPFTFTVDRRLQLQAEPRRYRQGLLHPQPLAAARRTARSRRRRLGQFEDDTQRLQQCIASTRASLPQRGRRRLHRHRRSLQDRRTTSTPRSRRQSRVTPIINERYDSCASQRRAHRRRGQRVRGGPSTPRRRRVKSVGPLADSIPRPPPSRYADPCAPRTCPHPTTVHDEGPPDRRNGPERASAADACRDPAL